MALGGLAGEFSSSHRVGEPVRHIDQHSDATDHRDIDWVLCWTNRERFGGALKFRRERGAPARIGFWKQYCEAIA